MLDDRKPKPGTQSDPDLDRDQTSQVAFTTVTCDPDLDRYEYGRGDTHWAEFGNGFSNPNVCD
jgi:hypothetical protein